MEEEKRKRNSEWLKQVVYLVDSVEGAVNWSYLEVAGVNWSSMVLPGVY
jgi:hypothetical protein